MIDEEMSCTISSGNVFADAGLPDAEECLARSELLYYIMTEIKRRGLSLGQAASLLGVPQSHVRRILDGRLSEFSLEYLLQMVKKLGIGVVISCQPAMEDGQGHVTVSLPQSA
jgi:predicted XRE-type DNA-binding protein